jgi:hypothetical protein
MDIIVMYSRLENLMPVDRKQACCVMIVNVWLELLLMSFPTIPTDLIEAIIGWVALLEPGLKKSTLFLCALTSRAFVFPSQKHIFCTIDLGARPPTGYTMCASTAFSYRTHISGPM